MSAHHIMRCRLAYSDEKHSREYKQHSYQFREGDNIKPKPYTYAGSHNRLNIIVHAYERRTQIFLPDHHAYIHGVKPGWVKVETIEKFDETPHAR